MRRAGFTLLELLVVVGILAALVALALPFYQDYVNQSKTTAAQADLTTFRKALAAYDQLEPDVYKSSTFTDMRGLIGKYLQDYRLNPAQTGNPKDPWGNEYVMDIERGIIYSRGPNQTDDTSALPSQTIGGDDIGVSWKPEFFISSVIPIADDKIRINFSRRLSKADIAQASVAVGALDGSGAAESYDSNFSMIITLSGNMVKNSTTKTCVITSGAIEAADGRELLSASKNEKNEDANQRTFIY